MSKQKIVIRKKEDETRPPEKTVQETSDQKSNSSGRVAVRKKEKTSTPPRRPKFSVSPSLLYVALGILIGAIAMFGYNYFFNKNKTETDNQVQHVTNIDNQSTNSIDNVSNNLDYSKNVLSSRGTLRQILVENGVASADANSLERKAISNNINNLNPGSKYTVYYDTDKIPKKLVLEPKLDPYNKHIIDLENFTITKAEKLRQIKEMSVAAIIETNLGKTFINNNLDLQLINKIEEIFAWSIDLFEISDGDRFKILYEEEYLDGKPYQIKEIKAAYFHTQGEDYYAFRYSQDNKFEYYNESGQTMKKSFLKTPIKYGGVITSGFGLRVHPVQKFSKMHYGTDFAAPEGTPIQAVADGVVLKAEHTHNNGNYVKIKHDQTYATQYLHMTRYADRMKPGVRVKQGEIIGYVGSTGMATGPHVCYRFWKNGEQVDPKKERVGVSRQINPKVYANYMNDILPLQDQLSKAEYQ